ncbi:MAG: hypothetical protein KDD69_00545 [Bdellovibrionales bacterium]|nr:hypothetical protein [Bdellovibrionales bacterium]
MRAAFFSFFVVIAAALPLYAQQPRGQETSPERLSPRPLDVTPEESGRKFGFVPQLEETGREKARRVERAVEDAIQDDVVITPRGRVVAEGFALDDSAAHGSSVPLEPHEGLVQP